MFQHFIALHNSRVAVFNRLEEFIFHVHFVSHLCIRSSGNQAVDNQHHIRVILILGFVNVHNLAVILVFERLVEHAQNFLQPVIDSAVQTRNLHNNAFMRQALNKRVGQSLRHHVTLVIIGMMFHVKNGFFYIAHAVSQQINGYHRDATTRQLIVLQHVIRIGILCAQILAEAERFGFEPRLL